MRHCAFSFGKFQEINAFYLLIHRFTLVTQCTKLIENDFYLEEEVQECVLLSLAQYDECDSNQPCTVF